MSKKPKRLFTPELIRTLTDHPNKYFEASLILVFDGRSCHWLSYNDKTETLFDMGCDSEERTITVDDFIKEYSNPNIRWEIEQSNL